ncbi:MAG: redoxin [Moraxellaceae bacterium]|nr:MAG: redoxin [Moraxellaceae bacterium]
MKRDAKQDLNTTTRRATKRPTKRHTKNSSHAVKISTLMLIMVFFSGLSVAKEINQPAPNFTLKSLSGKNLKLSEFRGQVILLNFWASWCGPCRQEMPVLEEIHNRYKDLGFTVLGVNVDEDSEKAKQLLKDIPVSFPVLLDIQNHTSELYHLEAMPTTILIDRDGTMRYLHKGYQPGFEEHYKQEIKALIRG